MNSFFEVVVRELQEAIGTCVDEGSKEHSENAPRKLGDLRNGTNQITIEVKLISAKASTQTSKLSAYPRIRRTLIMERLEIPFGDKLIRQSVSPIHPKFSVKVVHVFKLYH